MEKKLLLFLALLIVGFSYAQKGLSKDYSYTVSDPYKVYDAFIKDYFYKDGEVLTFKVNRKEILIQKMDASGDKVSFVKEKSYKIKDFFPGNLQVEDVIEFGGKYYFIYSSWDGDNDQEQLFYREVDFSGGEFVGENKLLFKVDGKIAQATDMGAETFYGKFNLHLTPDKTKMLINYRKKPLKKSDTKSYDTFGVNAYEANMNLLWNNEITMPYTERRMDLLDFTIDKEANAYMLAKVFHDDSNDDKKHKRDAEANYHIELFRIKAGFSNIDITKVDLQDKFVNKLALYEGADDYIVCAGFYNKGKSAGNVDGIMMFKAKKDGGIYDSASYEIPVEILNEYASKKTKKKNEKAEEEGEAEFKDLDLDKLLVEKDGSIVLVAEQYFTYTNYNSKMQVTYYHYADMLITKVDAAGKLVWMKRLPKHQIGTMGRGGMSYKHFFANNSHYIVYLDNVKNYDLPADQYPAVHRDRAGGYLTSFKINDATGESIKSSILNVREIAFHQFTVNRILKAGDDAFIIEVYKKDKEDIMLKVVMKK